VESESIARWKTEFPDVFPRKLSSVPAKVEEMDIMLNEGEVLHLPLSQSSRCYSEVMKKFIREVTKWLEAGIISPSNSSFMSQTVVVKTSGKDWRLYKDLDFQGLNAVTKLTDFLYR
jgi:hypothetical protein